MPYLNRPNESKAPPFPSISLIIPTLNAGDSLDESLASLPAIFHDIIISDGGSEDDTVLTAQKYKAKIIHSKKGRGNQLHQGTHVAYGDWFLFLHADTKLDKNAAECIKNFTTNSGSKRRLAHFIFKLDDKSSKSESLEKIVNWRNRQFALPYGDQGFLIHRKLYQELGGFHNHPLMEDVDLIWRLHKKVGKSAIVLLPAHATTSAEKFIKDGYIKRSLKNLFCLLLFRLGIPTNWIAKLY